MHKIIYKSIYAITYILALVLSSILASAYTGQTLTNISINITNTTITLWNDELGIQIINITNQTQFKNYSWNVDYEYNISGNVTIINYSQDCSYLEDDLDELKAKIGDININCTNIYKDEESYYLKYESCFTNYTICKEYRKSNEEFKSQYQSCIGVRDDYHQQNLKWGGDYYVLNQTYHMTVQERDNFRGQRIVYFIVGGLIIGGVVFFFLKAYPNIQRAGTPATSREVTPPIVETGIDLRKVKSAPERIAKIFPKKETLLGVPEGKIPNINNIKEVGIKSKIEEQKERELQQYIKTMLSKGFSKDSIRKRLQQDGWASVILDKIFVQLEGD